MFSINRIKTPLSTHTTVSFSSYTTNPLYTANAESSSMHIKPTPPLLLVLEITITNGAPTESAMRARTP